MFLVNSVGDLRILTADAKPKPKAGDRLISLVGHQKETEGEAEQAKQPEKVQQPTPA
jgi:hypothetical protein